MRLQSLAGRVCVQGDTSELVLEGMREILSICNQDVLPYLIPQLVATPLSLFHAQALAALSDVFGRGFSKYVQQVSPLH